MMNSWPTTNHVIDFHIGVDGVAEFLLRVFESDVCRGRAGVEYDVISAKDFAKYFRDAVNSNGDVFTNVALEEIGVHSRKVFVSRPRLLFDGSLMNLAGSELSTLYKIDNVQKAFSCFKINFHLVVTDHVTYLHDRIMRSVASSRRISSEDRFSWLPLVDGIQQRLVDRNSLKIWKFDDANLFLLSFLKDVLLSSPDDFGKISSDFNFINTNLSGDVVRKRMDGLFGFNTDRLARLYDIDVDILAAS